MMAEIDLSKIKYYPDRFYVNLDGFDTKDLTTFITDLNLGQQQAIFIHEYYHYLTNITTFPGVRQFHLNFCDRFSLTTILAYKSGLGAFPLKDNNLQDCQEEIEYWHHVTRIIEEDDLDYALVSEVNRFFNKKFEIVSVNKTVKSETFVIGGQTHNGGRHRVNIEIGGLINRNSFELTYGALDEFFSSAIDEYLFETDLATIDPRTLSQRPYYPYLFLDDLLKYYGIGLPSALHKILLVYYALNCYNPPLALIEILENMRDGGSELFESDPLGYISKRYVEPEINIQLGQIRAFSAQCFEQGRIHMAQALYYYGDRFYLAHQLKKQDFFYFVRPFLVQHEDKERFKQLFLLALARIIQVFTPPVILENGLFNYVDKLTTIGEATTFIIATYEIMESLKTQRIAKRPDYLKKKYTFPENDPNCDDITEFTLPPINGSYRIALNEIGLYPLYLYEAHPEYKPATESK